MDAESGAATEDWMGLQRSLLQLRMEIADTSDPDERAELVQRLRETRATLADIDKREQESATEALPEPQLEPEPELEPEPQPEPGPAVTGNITDDIATDDELDEGNDEEADPARRWPVVLAAAAVAVAAVGIGAIMFSRSSNTETDTAASEAATDALDTSIGESLDESESSEGAPATSESAPSDTLAAGQPSLRVSLYDHRFTSQGYVPDQQTADAIGQTSTAAFGDRSNVSIRVDDALDSPAWLTATPNLANELLLMVEGEIIVTGEETVVSGIATRRDRDQIIADLEAAGFPNVTTYVDVLAPNPAELTASVEGGTVSVRGILPDDATASVIVADLIAAFGQTNVNVDIEIDETKVARSAVGGFGADVVALSDFPNLVVGLENNSFRAVLDEGLEFEPGESDLDAALANNLEGLLPLLLRSTAPISVDGYTDNSGDHDGNHELSRLRAENVAAVLVEGGVDPARISVSGLADGNPVASNETAEGRARNRRIEITVG